VSIWIGHTPIGQGHKHFDDEERQTGNVLSFATGFSNHYPSLDGPEQPAGVMIAHIPSWCVPGHDEEVDWPVSGEWLRLEVASWAHEWGSGGQVITGEEGATVVLDAEAARNLGKALLEWADGKHLTAVSEGQR
jgi:hypothetical protein